jgi:hypothetical protein
VRHVVQLLTLGRRELGGHVGRCSEVKAVVVSEICTRSNSLVRCDEKVEQIRQDRSPDIIKISKVASRIDALERDNYQFGAAAEVT